MTTAKQALLQFLDKHGLRSGLSVSVETVHLQGKQPRFICTALVPVFDPKAGSFIGKPFVGEASTKKQAEHAAARKALDHIDAQGLLPEALKNTVPIIKETFGGDPPPSTAVAATNSGTPVSLGGQVPNQAQHQTSLAADSIPKAASPSPLPSEPQQDWAGQSKADCRDVRMPQVPHGLEADVEQQLGNRKLIDLTPLELKVELQKALDRNTELKNAIHHEQQRREKALSILLGLS